MAWKIVEQHKCVSVTEAEARRTELRRKYPVGHCVRLRAFTRPSGAVGAVVRVYNTRHFESGDYEVK